MILPTGYNNNIQIVQTPGFVVILHEMIHEARVIPLDGRSHSDPRFVQWLGEARGRWEGDTLVVDVTNFNGRVPYEGSDKNMHYVERIRRVASDEIEYTFTISDPTIWTKPFTGRLPMIKDDSSYELVEYACHEGNYAAADILKGARAEEAAEKKQHR